MAYQGKKLVNDPNDVVTEFIEGLVETYPGLQYLDGFPLIKVVLRADVSARTYDKVAVISGDDIAIMLSVLVVIPFRTVGIGGQLIGLSISSVVVLSGYLDDQLDNLSQHRPGDANYTGDRLNFGLAAEQAKSEGYDVEMVIVGDDCALPPPRGIAGRRGLAGTVLVNKVSGAAADAGLSLADVAAEAKHASEMVGTMGVALSVCTLPGQVTSDRLGPGLMELGLGIHGEPGAAVVELQPVDVIVSHVLKQILSQETQYVPITRGSRVVLMINGLGSTPLMELMIAARKAIPELQLEHGVAVDRVYTGTFMTSLDMAGFSISIMKSDEDILQRLDAPTKAPYWPVGVEGDRPPAKIPVPVPASGSTRSDEMLSKPQELTQQGIILEAAVEAAAKEIIALKDSLNEWDGKVGDGDCGTTMYRGAVAVLDDMRKRYPMNDAAETVNEIGATIRRRLDAGDDPVTAFLLSSEAAVNGAESTKNMHAQAGRSSYIAPDLLSSVPDPGAMAVAAWYKAAALAVKAQLRP
ncbi:putative 3,4-dihydroxy-2-butanone kinase [Ananas comosus]|uniref:Putative 3,4-dihydroxy-2-butanone kinase n=1 Tax=Ananas comosus TaxID=4615 RepID=A0A199W0B8_ANACO|nr:putative 3,4-dihydroxy-2-butanone kinase [Ananas comosus]